MTDALEAAFDELPTDAALLVAGLLVGAAVAVAYDGPYELLPVAAALALATVGTARRR